MSNIHYEKHITSECFQDNIHWAIGQAVGPYLITRFPVSLRLNKKFKK